MFHATPCAGPEGRERSDTIVTTFCYSVTCRCEAVISVRRRLVTTVMGEAMAPASEYQPSGGTYSGVGALLSLLMLLLLVACGDDQHQPSALLGCKPCCCQTDAARGSRYDHDLFINTSKFHHTSMK